MKFDDAAAVEQLCYEFKLGDYYRGQNRARINDLFNGVPPYAPEEVEANGIAVNVNYLEGTRMAHDARSQFYGAFLRQGKYFTASTDMGPGHKRSKRGAVVTREINRRMKRSMQYFETFRSKFALDVLHGIGPSAWDNRDTWCPDCIGVEDVLMPANTLLTMKNLPFFAIYRSYTLPELMRLTQGHKVDAGWNMRLVKECIEWVDSESAHLRNQNWPEVWSPEKMAERVKSDGGFYAGDAVPTIDCFDFYFFNDSDKEQGWNRRIILDAWGAPQASGGVVSMGRRQELDFGRDQFLFNSKNRKYGDRLSEIICFQFADLSAVAPFRYHSVRSLGFLLYALCHLQNRMRCKFNEAVFEALMMYFRVKSLDDAERALKIELISRGFIDETVQFVPAAERWQVDAKLVQLGMAENQRLIGEHMASFAPDKEQSRDRVEKTKFQVMAEMNAMMTMVSSALNQAYAYQTQEYQEIMRRFFKPNSSDPDVREFRATCLKQDVPESMMVTEAWDIEPQRVMGAGNKTLEMAISEQLMQFRPLYDPESQREILHDVTLAITDDPGRAERLVPESPAKVTDSVHDAQLVASALMQGLPVGLKRGMNHIEYVDTLLMTLELVIRRALKKGGMASADDIDGMVRLGSHIGEHIAIIAEDQNEKPRVTNYQKVLTKLMNEVKAFAQRLQQAQKQSGNGQQGLDPETQAKIQSLLITAKAKADNTRESHAQRTAQRRVQFEQEMKMAEQEHRMKLGQTGRELKVGHQDRMQEARVEAEKARIEGAKAALDLETQQKKADIEIRKSKLKSTKSE